MNLAIIKYNAGNIQSVLNALERIGFHAEVTDDHERIQSADKVIFPGVGEASSAMRSLRQNHLDVIIKDLKQPVLGICVGMQLLCAHSEENDIHCLNIIPIFLRWGGTPFMTCNPLFSKILHRAAISIMFIAIMRRTAITLLPNAIMEWNMRPLFRKTIFMDCSFIQKKVQP
jgi:hypothetical protein